jgi:hypothetical protein
MGTARSRIIGFMMLQQKQQWEKAWADREASKDKRASYGVASSQGVAGTENVAKKQRQITDNFGSWQGSTSTDYFNMARQRDTMFGN